MARKRHNEWAALEALATTGDKSAADTLAGLGQSAGIEGQMARARLGDPAAAETLAKTLAATPRDSDMIQRLGGVKARAVEDELIQLLANADPGTRTSAADALARSGSETCGRAAAEGAEGP